MITILQSLLFTEQCPESWYEFSSNCYKLLDELLTWQDAEDKCVEYGGNLASIHSSEENDFIVELSKKNTVWIGGSDIRPEAVWTWNDQSLKLERWRTE